MRWESDSSSSPRRSTAAAIWSLTALMADLLTAERLDRPLGADHYIAPLGRPERAGELRREARWAASGRRLARRRARRLIIREHRLKDGVGTPDARARTVDDERQHSLGVLRRHAVARPADVCQEIERDAEGDRYPVQAVDRNRLLTALDLADELPGQARALPEDGLAQVEALAQDAQPLSEERAHVRDRALTHSGLPFLLTKGGHGG